MKGFLVFLCLIALSSSLPTKSKYKVYKNPRSKDSQDAGTVPVHVTSGGDAAAVFPRVETTVTPITVPSTVEVVTEVTTEKLKTGNTPVGEPTKVPSAVPAFPPAVVEPEAVPAAGAVPSEAATVVDPTAPVSPGFPPPGPTIVPGLVTDPKVNGTSEEDDSSSEEGDEDEDEEERTLLSRRKSKSAKFPFSNANSLGKSITPKNPPLKYDLVINGFVTEDGQVLVPFDTYQKYFNQGQSKYLPPVYAITRDDTSPSTSAVVSEENEDKSSEETVPVRTQTKVDPGSKPEGQSESDSAEHPVTGSTSSEEGEVTGNAVSSNTGDSDEKDAPPSSENEKPAGAVAPLQETSNEARPLITSQPIYRPPLQVLPARLPTDEDDEEEAGRYLDHPFEFVPELDYDDDFAFHNDPEHYGLL